MIGIGFDRLDELNEGVFYLDEKRRIIYWNKGAEEISGYLKSECAGKFCYDNILCHEDECGKKLCSTSCPVAKTLKDGKPRNLEASFIHKDGEKVGADIEVKPLYDSTGVIRGAVQSFRRK
ncbi:MAG: PAS domain-containing protein [Deferribacterales bacterium]